MATKTAAKAQDDDLGENEEQDGFAARMNGMMKGTNAGGVSLRNVDLSKASTGYAMLEENVDFIFNVEKAEAKVSQTGNAMIVLSLSEQESNTKVQDYVTYGGDNPWKFKSLCHATGTLSDDGASFIGDSERDFVGKQVVGRVQHDLYQGEKRNKIKGGYKVVESGVEEHPEF